MRSNPVILQIGLIQYEPSWEFFFRQIGIPWKIVSRNGFSTDDFSVIIVNADIEGDFQHSIEDFVSGGGCVLFSTKAVSESQTKVSKTTFVTSIPPKSTPTYEHSDILDLYSTVQYFRNKDFIEIEQSGEGWKAFFGIDVDIVLSTESTRKNFYKKSGRMPNEVVAKRNKRPLRQVIFSLLRTLHHLQSLPFVHQWYFPESEPTIFTFRIDSDKGTQEQVDQIYQISDRHNIPTTWFLDVKSHESWLSYFHKFTKQEIGVHCYEHTLYPNALLNKDNFQKALTLLQKQNIHPKGITAPTGEWNNAYAEAIEQLGFQYSSEFAFDYDNLPSFPFINNSFITIPQIPIHPVCIGTMLRARMSDDAMIKYYRTIIDKNIVLNEPICFYHHPAHQHNNVFEEVFQYISERKIRALSYSQYAAWWKQRTSHIGIFRYSKGSIEPVNEVSDIHFRIIQPDNREAIVAVNERIHLTDLAFKQVNRALLLDHRQMESRRFDPKHLLQNVLDWWIKTTE